MKVGDLVEWTSQASGFTKTKAGHIVAVVPAGADPKSCIPQKSDGGWFQLKGPGMSRDHESYLVQVGKRINLYWPRVSSLKLVTLMNKEPECLQAAAVASPEATSTTGKANE